MRVVSWWWCLVLALIVGVGRGGAMPLKCHSALLVSETLTMMASLPLDSPWRTLLGSLGQYLLLAPWETPSDATAQNESLVQLVIRIESRPMAGAGQDMCTSVARAARELMGNRAADENQTRDRQQAIRARVGLIETMCRSILPDPRAPFTDAEEATFRTAKRTIYGLGSALG